MNAAHAGILQAEQISGSAAILEEAMAAKPLTLTIPEVLADELKSVSQDYLLELLERGLREVKIDRALELYGRGGMSFGAAAERAGVPASDFARSAYARGLLPPFSSETLREELG
jgi:predicted HTH domain antitoxin